MDEEQQQQQQLQHPAPPPPPAPPQQQMQHSFEGNGYIDPREPPHESSGLPKKVATSKYIKEEKIAILTVLLDLGMELWEMEKQINKPWRSLYWEQRVALPVRERLKNNAVYLEHGIDIDAKFGGAAAVENLRKWVRSQKTQELERVEGERQRVPGSPPGRPLSEVQKLRARVFEEIAAASSEKDGGGDGVADGDTEMVAAAAAVTAAAAGGVVQGGRDAGAVFASLFSSPSNGGASTAAPASSPAPSSTPSSPAPIHGGASVGLSNNVIGAGADPSSFLRQQYQLHAPSTSTSAATTPNGVASKSVLLRPSTAAGGTDSNHCSIPDTLINSIDVGGGGADTYVSASGTSAVVSAAAAAARAVNAATMGVGLGAAATPRRRSVSETTPEDFRLGGAGLVSLGGGSAGLPPPPAKRKKKAEDHTELVGKVMTQINSLNLPLAASNLLVQSLQAKIASSTSSNSGGGSQGGGVGSISAVGGTAMEEWNARGVGLSLEERQLLLEERLQASREAEAAQALAERRLKLMEEMRAAGNHHVVTDEVLQKQRLVVLGL